MDETEKEAMLQKLISEFGGEDLDMLILELKCAVARLEYLRIKKTNSGEVYLS